MFLYFSFSETSFSPVFFSFVTSIVPLFQFLRSFFFSWLFFFRSKHCSFISVSPKLLFLLVFFFSLVTSILPSFQFLLNFFLSCFFFSLVNFFFSWCFLFGSKHYSFISVSPKLLFLLFFFFRNKHCSFISVSPKLLFLLFVSLFV